MQIKVVVVLIVVSLFLVSCVQEMSEEQLEEELNHLSDEELKLVIQEANISNENVVGEAQKLFFQKYNAQPEIVLRVVRKIELKMLQNNVVGSTRFLNGCHIQINDKDVKLGNSLANCEDIFIANSFVGKSDFYKLLNHLGYIGFTQEEILNINNKITIYYKNDEEINSFVNIENDFVTTSCQETNYFGFKLYCFNGVNTSTIQKENNLKQIITYFTFLLYTSNNGHYNELIEESTSPYRFILSNNIRYYDASLPEAYSETLASTNCRDSEGAANYQDKNGLSFVFVCDKLLEEEPSGFMKIKYAAILYHEANHKYQQGHMYSHNEDHMGLDMNELEVILYLSEAMI
ncbi:hypothetical protein COV17_00420 [Candidatus Woesearchaeota archaeon CG10_big_fil_rev_8_21_14_0_10_36_11]|nr:MAG: hypothetical protein COV17_00420 [Candidatus Woesearchaeota archaeon CG10_big_fil_rev_8_21_14_0_10_36_11]